MIEIEHAYRRLAPHASRNHRMEEHLLPLFVALGAAAPEPGQKNAHERNVCRVAIGRVLVCQRRCIHTM